MDIIALAIQDAKIRGQRQRFSDDYANEMALAAMAALESTGYAIVRRDSLGARGNESPNGHDD